MESWRVELAAFCLQEQRRITEALLAVWDGVPKELEPCGLDSEPYVREVERLRLNIEAGMENLVQIAEVLKTEKA